MHHLFVFIAKYVGVNGTRLRRCFDAAIDSMTTLPMRATNQACQRNTDYRSEMIRSFWLVFTRCVSISAISRYSYRNKSGTTQAFKVKKENIMLDNELVTELYQKHAHIIYKYIYTSLQRREEAEDILVEVFLAALRYQNLVNLNEQQQFSWLLAVARNKLADWQRQVMRLPSTSLERLSPMYEDALKETHEPEAMIIKREEYAMLQQQISQLSTIQQDVLHLRFIIGLRHAEIAVLLNKTEGAVQVIFWRAIRSLRSLYQQEALSRRKHE